MLFMPGKERVCFYINLFEQEKILQEKKHFLQKVKQIKKTGSVKNYCTNVSSDLRSIQ